MLDTSRKEDAAMVAIAAPVISIRYTWPMERLTVIGPGNEQGVLVGRRKVLYPDPCPHQIFYSRLCFSRAVICQEFLSF